MATAEDTILTKLEWSKLGESERQIRDAAGILTVKAAELDREYVESWAKELGITELWQQLASAPSS